MKITVEFSEEEFAQFMEWRRSSATPAESGAFLSVGDGSSIYHLCLSTYTTNCLLSADIKTIGEARLASQGERLLALAGFGRKSLKQLREAIRNFDAPNAARAQSNRPTVGNGE